MPEQVLKAIDLYSLHCYGSMLWEFGGIMTGKFCRSWTTCAKLVYNLPRSTHTYIVDHYLVNGFIPVQTELFARYVKFHKSLQKSLSFEVRYLLGIIKKDINANTVSNLTTIQRVTGLNPMSVKPTFIRQNPVISEIPEQQMWRIPLLDSWLTLKKHYEAELIDTKYITMLIDALCST